MKKLSACIPALFILLIYPLVASTQTVNQGTWMFGGSAAFSSTKVKDVEGKTTVLDLSPNLGLFIIDDLAAGMSVGFNSTSSGGNSDNSFGIGPIVRYYFTDPIFAQMGMDFGLDDESSTNFDISVGYSWFIDNTLAIESSLFFTSFNFKDKKLNKNTFGLSIGIQAFAGRD